MKLPCFTISLNVTFNKAASIRVVLITALLFVITKLACINYGKSRKFQPEDNDAYPLFLNLSDMIIKISFGVQDFQNP